MRRIALGATLGAAALLAVPWATASARELTGLISARGGVTISWHGDPARGCAAAGLCGYRGSVTAAALEFGEYSFRVSKHGVFDSGSYVELTDAPLVRVRRTEGGTEAGTCADLVPAGEFGLSASRAGAGRARIGINDLTVSPGRCGGPKLDRAVVRIPRDTVSLSRLRSKGATVDLSGSRPYQAGRFSGTVTSTLRLRFARSARPRRPLPNPGRRPPRPRGQGTVRVRTVHFHAVYRITRFAGKLSASFGGTSDASCEDFDGCGVTGMASWAIDSSGGALVIEGDAIARRSDHGLRGALAAGVRHNSVYAEVRQPRFFGTTTADVSRQDGVACHDTARAPSPGLEAAILTRRLFLGVGREDFSGFDTNLIRTGCPGPRDLDAFDPFNFAHGFVPLSLLSRRSFRVVATGGDPFSAAGYDGTGSGRFTIALRRRSLRVAYGHERVPR